MEHYLGEKLKKLRESRGWTQADLAKRLNKAVSTVSGYESDAHAIPLDVLSSISSLFSISTDPRTGCARTVVSFRTDRRSKENVGKATG